MKEHSKILAIQGDPLSSINRKTDTTLLLALEAQRRKYKIYYYETKNVTFKNKKVYVATNLLESMIHNKYPTRGEANDVYNTLESGAAGLVLAAETAIGKYPKECVIFLKKELKVFNYYK